MPVAWIAQNVMGSQRHLHSEEGCWHLQQADSYRSVDASNYPNNPRCSYCFGDGPERCESNDMGPYNALKAAAGGGD